MKKMSDQYNSNAEDVPDGGLVKAEVIVFSDGSIHVGGHVSMTMKNCLSESEDAIATALEIGLEMMGYDVELTPGDDGTGEGVQCTSIGVDPMNAIEA